MKIETCNQKKIAWPFCLHEIEFLEIHGEMVKGNGQEYNVEM